MMDAFLGPDADLSVRRKPRGKSDFCSLCQFIEAMWEG
jgi:hypothetical protein